MFGIRLGNVTLSPVSTEDERKKWTYDKKREELVRSLPVTKKVWHNGNLSPYSREWELGYETSPKTTDRRTGRDSIPCLFSTSSSFLCGKVLTEDWGDINLMDPGTVRNGFTAVGTKVQDMSRGETPNGRVPIPTRQPHLWKPNYPPVPGRQGPWYILWTCSAPRLPLTSFFSSVCLMFEKVPSPPVVTREIYDN